MFAAGCVREFLTVGSDRVRKRGRSPEDSALLGGAQQRGLVAEPSNEALVSVVRRRLPIERRYWYHFVEAVFVAVFARFRYGSVADRA